ncbi:MAG: riboflavin biosynthesis protein RibF [Clostridia bacterium]|nr:riboflavin biosynthesis protein RibF [Clostridia bacterium]
MSKIRIAAIGDFDGVHRGHQAILQQLRQWAQELDAEPTVISFDRNTKGRRVLTDAAVKQWYLQQYGIGSVVTLPFDEWKDVAAEEFIDRCLKNELNIVGIVAGEDLHFGKDRGGNAFTLIAKGIAVRKVEPVCAEELQVRSSVIRSLIEAGELSKAERLSGHPFTLMGEVRHGKGLARQYDLPTVNLALAEAQLLPPFGVYAARVWAEEICYPAVANVGVRPTVEQNAAPNLEAHILAEVPELYGQTLRVELCSYLRGERKFEDEAQLFAQIKEDGERSMARLEMLK